jgi:hypothetical protein
VRLVIAADVGGLTMFMYSLLLIRLNRRVPSPEIRPGGSRSAALVWAFLLFGVLAALTLVQQATRLWGGGLARPRFALGAEGGYSAAANSDRERDVRMAPTYPNHGRIDGRVVIIGFCSIWQGSVHLLERHFT